MIETHYPPDAFADAIASTAYMATALLSRGELLLPQRIREHLADGPVVVHLLRGEDDVARCEATLTSESRLSGIDWPADVQPRMSLLVLCPRGGASHDIGVVLPELDEYDRADDGLCEKCVAPYVNDPEGLGLCRRHLTEHYVAEADAERRAEDELDDEDVEEDADFSFQHDWREIDVQIIRENGGTVAGESPSPADYEVPTTLQPPADAPTETIPAVEQTAITPAAGVIDWPADEPDDDEDPFGFYAEGEPEVSRWRRALAWVRTNTTPTRAVYAAATGGTFLGSLLTWLVTR